MVPSVDVLCALRQPPSVKGSLAITYALLIAALLTWAPLATGQEAAKGGAEGRVTAPKEFEALEYRSIGPAAGGRVSRAAGVPGDPYTYYVATASGGVWKSIDGGITWKPVFDDQPVSSIGSMAIAPSDPNVIYVGSGEANIRGNVAAGNGIYKSTDAGKTWTHIWKQEGQIGTMVVHPGNPDVAFAAVLGHAFGPNPERGVYRTTDGGKTWQQVLKKDADTGASDVAMDPSNPRILFAGFWQARRKPWDLMSGGPGSGLYRSRDGGETWTQITEHGLPEGIWGKVGVAVAPSDGRRVYALIEAEQGGLFRSDDGGETWQLANSDRGLRQRPWYYSTLTVNPRNPDDVWFPQVPMLRTIDGGKTITYVKKVGHGDHHDMWIDPLDPRRMIGANDGGVSISTDGGESWTSPMLPISQFYHVSIDTRVPYRVAGAMQDLGTAQGPSNSLSRAGITSGDWYGVGGGEAGHVVSDPSDPDIVYAGEYLGYISRYDHRTRQSRNVGAWPENPSGHGGEDMKYRFQWTAPIATSPHDPKVVYHGAQVLFETTDGGQSWTAISPDLTRNDKSKQGWAGGPITGDNTGVETYCTIFAVAESPRQQGLIWVGSDDGLVHVTRDGGKSWSNLTPSMTGFPEWGTVSLIEPSPHDAGTAYVVVDAHRLDDVRPYLFKTSDYGKSWSRLDGTLPQDTYLHAVREDPKRKGQLYVGTEHGVMYSVDDGAAWQPLQLNLPTVAVHDLVVKDDSLVLATHGRSLWILDDLTPLREMSSRVASGAIHLFSAADTIGWRFDDGSKEWNGGTNPPSGAMIYYFLKDKPKGDVTIDILDAKGQTIRTLSSTPPPPMGVDDDAASEKEGVEKLALPAKPGVQRAVWDLRHEGARRIKNAKIDLGDPSVGPLVAPGTYSVKLTVDGQSRTTSLRVLADPRSKTTQADLEAQVTFVLQVRDEIGRLTGLVERLRSIKQQLQQRLEVPGSSAGAGELGGAARALIEKCDALEDKLHNPTAEVTYDILAMKGGTRLYSRLIPTMDFAKDGDGAPTEGMRQVFDAQVKELNQYEAQVQALVSTDLAAVNAMAAKLGVAFVVVP